MNRRTKQGLTGRDAQAGKRTINTLMRVSTDCDFQTSVYRPHGYSFAIAEDFTMLHVRSNCSTDERASEVVGRLGGTSCVRHRDEFLKILLNPESSSRECPVALGGLYSPIGRLFDSMKDRVQETRTARETLHKPYEDPADKWDVLMTRVVQMATGLPFYARISKPGEAFLDVDVPVRSRVIYTVKEPHFVKPGAPVRRDFLARNFSRVRPLAYRPFGAKVWRWDDVKIRSKAGLWIGPFVNDKKKRTRDRWSTTNNTYCLACSKNYNTPTKHIETNKHCGAVRERVLVAMRALSATPRRLPT